MSENWSPWCCKTCLAVLGTIVMRNGERMLHIVKPGSLELDAPEAFVVCHVCGEERRWMPSHRGRKKMPIDKR